MHEAGRKPGEINCKENESMKKIIALVLAAMMVLSLAACGAKTEAPAAE